MLYMPNQRRFRRSAGVVEAAGLVLALIASHQAIAQQSAQGDVRLAPASDIATSADEQFRKEIFDQARSGAPAVALERARARSDLFTPADMLDLEWILASNEVVWGNQQAQVSQEPDRLSQMREALAHIDAIIKRIPPTDDLREQRIAMLSLRVRALAGLGLMKEACALYERLTAVTGALPAATYAAAGDAYTYRNMPRQAAAAYERALFTPNLPIRDSHTPHALKRIDIEEGLFFAYLDAGRFKEAQAFLTWVQKNTPKHDVMDDDPDEMSEEYARVEKLQAQYLVYTSRAQFGARALDKLRVQAPLDPMLQAARADASAVQDRPREAWGGYTQMLVDHPGDVEALAGLGKTDLELAQYDRATQVNSLFGSQFPESVPVRNFQNEYQAYRSPELIVTVNGQKGNSVLADNDWSIDSLLYSAPIANYWRIYAHQFSGHADTGDGEDIGRVRNGLGGDFRYYGWDGSLEVDRSTGSQARTGAAGLVTYEPTDRWTFGAGFDTNDNTLPWKAYQQNVTGRTLDGSVRYQVDDYRYFDLGYGASRYSDSNVHQQWTGSWFERLYSTPAHELSMTVDADTNSNTLADTLYYAPARDFTGQATLKYQWTPWRDGDRSFSQNVYGTVGDYAERGFGSSFLWEVRLEQQWKFGTHATLTYGIGVSSQCYDGAREFSKLAYLNLNIPL
jgi:biofilm PGA synthesis protein PgaA